MIRASRGIKRPVVSEDTYLEAKRKVSADTPTFRSAHLIKTDDFELTISKDYITLLGAGVKLSLKGSGLTQRRAKCWKI